MLSWNRMANKEKYTISPQFRPFLYSKCRTPFRIDKVYNYSYYLSHSLFPHLFSHFVVISSPLLISIRFLVFTGFLYYFYVHFFDFMDPLPSHPSISFSTSYSRIWACPTWRWPRYGLRKAIFQMSPEFQLWARVSLCIFQSLHRKTSKDRSFQITWGTAWDPADAWCRVSLGIWQLWNVVMSTTTFLILLHLLEYLLDKGYTSPS